MSDFLVFEYIFVEFIKDGIQVINIAIIETYNSFLIDIFPYNSYTPQILRTHQ